MMRSEEVQNEVVVTEREIERLEEELAMRKKQNEISEQSIKQLTERIGFDEYSEEQAKTVTELKTKVFDLEAKLKERRYDWEAG